jgi:conjugal transfer pilin signal peptidase TrbI
MTGSQAQAGVLWRGTEWVVRDGWVKRCAFVLAGVSLIACLASPWYGIYVRDDESLPQYSFFLIDKQAVPKRGDYVAFEMTQAYADRVMPQGPMRPYARVGRLWLKAAYGVAGDPVRVEGRTIYVNDRKVATVIERDIYRQQIEPAELPSVIPEGFYYLGLPHQRSFDSRVIGLVEAKDVRGVVWPIF